MFSGNLDRTCSHRQAKITESMIGERVRKFVSVPKATHGYWGGHLDDWVYDILVETLKNPEHDSNEDLSSVIYSE